MAQARRWLWGLIPVAALWLAASWWTTAAIEADIAGRVAPVLRSVGWTDNDYAVQGRDVTLTGPAYELPSLVGTSRSSWSDEVDSITGVRLVRDRSQALIEARPSLLEASKRGDVVVLSGSVPRPQVRDEILAELNKLGMTAQDRTTFAKGAREGLVSAASLAFGQLARLADGNAVVIDDTISITGTAPDMKASLAIRSALNAPPTGFKLGEVELDVPPLDFTAVKDAIAKTLTLSGDLPDEASRVAVLGIAREQTDGASIVDRSTIREAALPDGFSAMAVVAMRSLASLTEGKLALHGSEVTLTGTAPNAGTSDTIRNALGSLPAGYTQGASKIDVPTLDLTATRDAASNTLTLKGVFPDEATRHAILESSQQLFGNARIVDQTTRQALTAPRGFAVSALVALRSLARLTDGTLTVIGSDIELSGTAADRNASGAIRSAFENLPAGFKLGELKIKEPPYEFTATKDSTAGTLTLEGVLPDETTRQSVIEAARNLFFRERVVDQTALDATGAPSDFSTTTLEALRALSRLDAGKVTLGESGAKMTGTTFYPRAADDIRTSFAALGGSLKGSAEISLAEAGAPVESAECQTLLNDLLGRGRILFETASARIDRASAGLLDSIVGTALRCRSSKLEIGGHTDSKGQARANADLSRRRAEAVVGYLVGAGIEQSKLKAVGYGSRNPIASNDTEEERAKNRRIEILVK